GRACSFKPFVKVPIIKCRTAMASFGQASGNAEILQELAVVCALHDAPHRRYCLGAAKFEPFGPEPMSPADLVEIDGLEGSCRGEDRSEGKQESQTSKSEIRNKSEARNSKFVRPNRDHFGLAFEIRICLGFRHSNFGFTQHASYVKRYTVGEAVRFSDRLCHRRSSPFFSSV